MSDTRAHKKFRSQEWFDNPNNPGMTALDAALHPTKSEFWYYLHDSSGVIHPSRNVREHEAYRKKYNVY